MGTRIEVTKRLKDAYRVGSRTEKGVLLDYFCQTTGLARSTGRRYLTSPTLGNPKVARLDQRRKKKRKYSGEAIKVLIRIWRLMGCQCGKYMAASMGLWLASLKAHGELVAGQHGFTAQVEAELLAMSGASIDRYLKEERERLACKGISATRPSQLLRNSIKIRKAGDEIEDEPGFFEVDTVAHCGPTLKGEFARTLTQTRCEDWVGALGGTTQ